MASTLPDSTALQLLIAQCSFRGIPVGKPTTLAEFQNVCGELINARHATDETRQSATGWIVEAIRSARRGRTSPVNNALKNAFP